ncbi:uncharacterized protein A4U43_C03F26980 [Asparagus officinalis]|uniref:Leucine-rich repeat-containing N-terminal plant-type domain-containing protein n=1 Tax=Asparagus officinalis TaxID=4686 RepID=A0A5P1FIF6_ASPOF|nr:uncharacterized protein A4U43_C03F26980 [Asparagus officinalis]
MEFYASLLAVFSFTLLLFTSLAKVHSNITFVSALLAFKASVRDPYNILSTNWTINTSCCTWTYISCNHKTQRLIALDLQNLPLYGTISPHTRNLSYASLRSKFHMEEGGMVRKDTCCRVGREPEIVSVGGEKRYRRQAFVTIIKQSSRTSTAATGREGGRDDGGVV